MQDQNPKPEIDDKTDWTDGAKVAWCSQRGGSCNCDPPDVYCGYTRRRREFWDADLKRRNAEHKTTADVAKPDSQDKPSTTSTREARLIEILQLARVHVERDKRHAGGPRVAAVCQETLDLIDAAIADDYMRSLAWHAPGLGKVHSADHDVVIHCKKRDVHDMEQGWIADDDTACYVAAKLNMASLRKTLEKAAVLAKRSRTEIERDELLAVGAEQEHRYATMIGEISEALGLSEQEQFEANGADKILAKIAVLSKTV